MGGWLLNCVPVPPGSTRQTMIDGDGQVAQTDARSLGPHTIFLFGETKQLVVDQKKVQLKELVDDKTSSLMHPYGQYLSHSDFKINFWEACGKCVAPTSVSASTKV